MRPILFHAFGYQAASAPIFAGVAALFAYLYFSYRRSKLGLNEENFWLLMGTLAAGVFVGSIVFYAAFFGGGWSQNWEHWRRYHSIEGGASMGTFAGAIGALGIFARWKRVRFAPLADALGGAAAIGLFFMRIGCLLNGCDYGRPTTVPWAIVFTGPCAVPRDLRGTPLHPTQIYEGLAGLAIFLFIVAWLQPRVDKGRIKAGASLMAFVGLYGALRFWLDFTRGSDPGVITPLGLTATQWVCAAAVAATAAALARRRPA